MDLLKKNLKENRTKILFLLFGLLWINSVAVYAQADYVTLITGTLFNAQTREPVQTTITFINEAGKEIKAQSEINGQYQAVLTSGKKYAVTIKDYLVSNEEADFALPLKKEYSEFRKNFELMKINKGMQLLAIDAFGPNMEVLNSNALTQILKLKSFLYQNKNVKVKIYLSTEDTYANDTKAQASKSKKDTKKTPKLSSKERLNELLQKRTSNLQDILTSLKILENRYVIEGLAIPAEKPTKAPKKTTKKGKATTNKNDDGNKLITLKIEIDTIIKF